MTAESFVIRAFTGCVMVLHTRLSLREVGIRFRTNDVGRRKSIRLLCAFANWGEDEE